MSLTENALGPEKSRRLALKLLEKYGLAAEGWSFQFNRGLKLLGACNYSAKKIELSKYFVKYATRSEVKEVILHEIAHAKAGSNAAHGPLWQEECRKIGIKPEVTYDAIMPLGKYHATCKVCFRRYNSHRRPNKGVTRYCGKCERQEKTILEWKE